MAHISRLKPLFPSLSADNLIARGSAGHVFAIGETAVSKCPTVFDHAGSDQPDETEESIQKIENEKAVHDVLIKRRRPNIIHTILCISQGFFMQRLDCTLQSRINQHASRPMDQSARCKWIQQLTSAVAWLEGLGYAHGDLRPTNALLDFEENIKLSDFDATVRFGEQLLVATEPFCRVNKSFEPPIATPVTEHFALGGCIYTIQYCKQPFAELEAPLRVRMLRDGEFPSTSSDQAFGKIVQRCWNGTFRSTKELELVIQSRILDYFAQNTTISPNSSPPSILSHNESEALLLDCKHFLSKESLSQ